jgi:membrane protein involved in colicin uptake
MGLLDAFRTKTPAEQLRENKRMIDRAIRELDRERVKMEMQEKKTVAEMKKLAKAGQKVVSGAGAAVRRALIF